MSRGNLKKVKNFDFVERFVEVCGSSQAADIARLLNISYQAAKNYLEGRLPDSNVLITIAEQTNYSIHWLLTGQGNKFTDGSPREDTLLLSGKLREFVRRECREVINEALSNSNAQIKTVVLSPEKIKEEKVLAEANAFSGKQQ
jgi:transcriptional regulator with XRE-family HTH domain